MNNENLQKICTPNVWIICFRNYVPVDVNRVTAKTRIHATLANELRWAFFKFFSKTNIIAVFNLRKCRQIDEAKIEMGVFAD